MQAEREPAPTASMRLMYPKNAVRRHEEDLKRRYLENGGSPADPVITSYLLLRVIQHSARVEEAEAREIMGALYTAGAIRLGRAMSLLVLDGADVREMVAKYEREVPPHECEDGPGCRWPEWPCGYVWEWAGGRWMGGMPGEELKPINPDFPAEGMEDWEGEGQGQGSLEG